MEKIKVSVIVPAYNTELYIKDMIECLINQTYKNIQMIFVNDGSTDKTEEIIKSFKDDRIEYYYQENAGVSAARNLGISKAKGDKIFFFDSDDTFEYTLIEKCMEYSKINNVESVLYGYADKINGEISNEHSFKIDGCYKDNQIVDDVMPAFLGHSYNDVNDWILGKSSLREGKEHTALWRIMLDSKVIRKNNILFDINLSLGEDTKFMNTYLLFTKSVGVLKETLYYLTIREGSANVTNSQNPFLMAENKEKLIVARKEIDEIARKSGKDVHEYWQGTMIFSAAQLAVLLRKSGKRGKEVFYKYINNKDVKKAINGFKPIKFNLKSIPFYLLKANLGNLLFNILKAVPDKLVTKFI